MPRRQLVPLHPATTLNFSRRRHLLILALACGLVGQTIWLVREGWGLRANYYHETDGIGTPWHSRIERHLTVTPETGHDVFRADRFGIRWIGWIVIETAGPHRFLTRSDDGSYVIIDRRVVVDNGGVHAITTVEGTIDLEAGVYPIEFRYDQQGGEAEFTPMWVPPGRPESRIPSVVLYTHRPGNFEHRIRTNGSARGIALALLMVLSYGFASLLVGWMLRFLKQTPPESSPSPADRGRRTAGILVVALPVVLFCLYAPALNFILTTDHDALAYVGYIRASGQPLLWPGGGFRPFGLYAFGMERVVERLGFPGGDLLFSYKLVVISCLALLVVLVFRAGRKLTRRPLLSLGMALCVGLAPGMVRLLVMSEDNLISSCFHVLYLTVYLDVLAGLHGADTARGRVDLARLLLPVTLALAVVQHQQNAVVLLTPAFLPVLSPKGKRTEAARAAAFAYFAGGGLFALYYAWGTSYRDGASSLSAVMGNMVRWFNPGRNYGHAYSWNRFGWDPTWQLRLGTGVGGSFLVRLNHVWHLVPFLAVGYWLCRGEQVWSGLFQDWRIRSLLLFTVIHIPHSLVFDPWDIERWDVLVPVVALLGAVSIDRFLASPSRRIGAALYSKEKLAALAVGMLGAYYTWGYAARFSEAVAEHRGPEARAFLDLVRPQPLERRDNPGSRSEYVETLTIRPSGTPGAAVRPVLVLDNMQFWKYFMFAQAYYDYSDSIFAVVYGDRVLRSIQMYRMPRDVPVELFRQIVTGRPIVAGPATRLQVEKLLVPGEDTHT